MKLFLSSNGITDDTLRTEFFKLLDKPIAECQLAFIPTASDGDQNTDAKALIGDIVNCQNLGCAKVVIVDISAEEKTEWLPRLQQADVIVMGGGNTFYLLDWVNKSGLRAELPALLATRVYVGISAGTILVCPDIAIAGWDLEWDQNLVGIKDLTGLNYINKLISPHYVSGDHPLLEAKQRTTECEIIGITDKQAVVVDGEQTRVVGSGEIVSFK